MNSFSCPIAITGASAITVAGSGLAPVLDAMRAGRACLQPVPVDLLEGVEDLLWGRANQFKATDFMPPLKARKLDRGSQFAVAAAGLALTEAGIATGNIPGERIGIALGCGFGALPIPPSFCPVIFSRGWRGCRRCCSPTRLPMHRPAMFRSNMASKGRTSPLCNVSAQPNPPF